MKTMLFKNLNTVLLHKEKRCLDARTYPIDQKIGLVKSTNKKQKKTRTYLQKCLQANEL